jgi:hypothetical protein
MNYVEINERGLFNPRAGLLSAETLTQPDVQRFRKVLHELKVFR